MTELTLSNFIINGVNIIAGVITIIIGRIGIHVYLTQKDKIISLFEVLGNYFSQSAINDIITKLDSTQTLDPTKGEEKEMIFNTFSEVLGLLEGNHILKEECTEIIDKIDKFLKSKKDLNRIKHRLLGEIKSHLKSIDLKKYHSLLYTNPKDG